MLLCFTCWTYVENLWVSSSIWAFALFLWAISAMVSWRNLASSSFAAKPFFCFSSCRNRNIYYSKNEKTNSTELILINLTDAVYGATYMTMLLFFKSTSYKLLQLKSVFYSVKLNAFTHWSQTFGFINQHPANCFNFSHLITLKTKLINVFLIKRQASIQPHFTLMT